ncbi:TRAP transporter small permease [Marivita sp. S2033]|uniref:TRAP transporter small permease n=1 Tax=Marivita sp. S2033 TaxID=3373187 RepID=UPI003982ABE2
MHSAIHFSARVAALIGGIVLVGLVVLTCVSVLGRGLVTLGYSDWLGQGLADALLSTGVGPVSGDFELVEAGVAFAIFAFLPVCQLHGGHATVNVFTDRLPLRANAWLVAFWEGLLALVILLVTWRLSVGMMDKFANQETTFLLQFPVWWAYAASLAAAVVASVTAIYCAWGRVVFALTGRSILPAGGAETG